MSRAEELRQELARMETEEAEAKEREKQYLINKAAAVGIDFDIIQMAFSDSNQTVTVDDLKAKISEAEIVEKAKAFNVADVNKALAAAENEVDLVTSQIGQTALRLDQVLQEAKQGILEDFDPPVEN